MKKLLLTLALFPAVLFARDFSGEWRGNLFSASAHGRCDVVIRIAHTEDFFVVSPRTYVCEDGAKFTFGLIWLRLGQEVTTVGGHKYFPLLSDGSEVGRLNSDGKFGQIAKTPDGSFIGRFGFYASDREDIYWTESIANPGFTMQGSLKQ